MDHIGDWLYILIVLGIFLRRFFGKEQTAKKTTYSVPDNEEEQNRGQHGIDWRQLLKEIGEIADDAGELTHAPAPTPEKIEETAPYRTDRQPEKIKNYMSDARKNTVATVDRSKKQPQTHPSEEPLASQLDFSDMDELKRAVICSEILNRKYT